MFDFVAGVLGQAMEPDDVAGAPELVKAAKAGDVKMVERLLACRRFHPDIRWNKNTTPLHYAVQNECPDVVRVLVRHAANPNLQNSSGWTALHMAVAREDREIVLLLLDSGADPSIRTFHHRLQPIHWARSAEFDEEVLRLLAPGKGKSLVFAFSCWYRSRQLYERARWAAY